MNPQLNQYGPTLIVLAEWKLPNRSPIKLITSAIRRNNPQYVDSKIHHNNLINNILAKIQANVSGVDDAIMLDSNGFVSETNSMNIFIVKKGKLFTPTADSCLPGITRAAILECSKQSGISATQQNLSLTEVYTADEVFTTGTMVEIVPVSEVDGRKIGNGETPVTKRIHQLLLDYIETYSSTPLQQL